MIYDYKEMAKSRVQQTFKGIPKEQINEFVIYGTPKDVLALRSIVILIAIPTDY
jgi:hypothetical protein